MNLNIKKTLKKLAKETEKTKQSKNFKDYIQTIIKFWNYSYYNQLLIYSQFPNATKVAGFSTWKKLKRKVIKNSTAIKILAPIIKETKNKKTGKKEKITYFKPVNVFDISQTKGKALPEININNKGNDHIKLLKKLLQYCKEKKINVKFENIKKKELYGYTSKNSIILNKNKNINTQFDTLLHELAHNILHKNSNLSTQQKEIQAEATGYIICQYLGLKSKSFNYLALYDADYKKIMVNMKAISKAVKKIINVFA